MKATSEDLRIRIVKLVASGISQRKVAKRLMTSQGTVWSVTKRYRETGSIKPGKSPGRPRCFTGRRLKSLKRYVEKYPDATLAEIETHYKNRNIPCSSTSIRNALKLLKISYKKKVCLQASKKDLM